MIVFLYGAPAMFGIKYNLVDTPMRTEDGKPTYRLQHYTFLFQTFVMMNLFNMWNCRVLPTNEKKELNIFSRIQNNWWFVIIFFGEVNMQYFMTSYNWVGVIFDSTPPTLAMQMTSLGVALGSWLVALSVKYIPAKYFNWFDMPEEENAAGKSRLNAVLNSAAAQAAAEESE